MNRLLFLILLIATPAMAAPRILAARGQWAALGDGHRCEAASRALRVATGQAIQARAAIAFDPTARRPSQFHARLSRPARPDSATVLTVGETPFLLATRGLDAWSGGPAQAEAIIAAMRLARSMRVESSGAGGRFVDRYLIDGAPTAIDAAAAACAPATLVNR